MWQKLLSDSSFSQVLLKRDRELAEDTRSGGCPCCSGVLHVANFPRKPRGLPESDPGSDCELRLSFCCAKCRQRATPPSVRFLGRRVYVAVAVILGSALAQGLSRKRIERVHELIGVSERALRHWLSWWQETLPETSFWKSARGRFARPLENARLPEALLEAFQGRARERLLSLLDFLSPLSTEQSR